MLKASELMVLRDRTYGFLKWLIMIAVPAFLLGYSQVATALGWDNVQVVSTVTLAVSGAIGTMLGISTKKYNANASARANGTLKVVPGRAKDSVKYALEFDDDSVFDLAENSFVTFRIDDSAVKAT